MGPALTPGQLEKQQDNVAALDLEYVKLSVPKTLALLNKVRRAFSCTLGMLTPVPGLCPTSMMTCTSDPVVHAS